MCCAREEMLGARPKGAPSMPAEPERSTCTASSLRSGECSVPRRYGSTIPRLASYLRIEERELEAGLWERN
jgi:hypothetical protein